jgi:hypothetical protein
MPPHNDMVVVRSEGLLLSGNLSHVVVAIHDHRIPSTTYVSVHITVVPGREKNTDVILDVLPLCVLRTFRMVCFEF